MPGFIPESSRDGVYFHGLNRVARFVDHIKRGFVDVNAEPTLLKQSGVFENHDGNLGPGVLNALFAVNRAVEVAKEHDIGRSNCQFEILLSGFWIRDFFKMGLNRNGLNFF